MSESGIFLSTRFFIEAPLRTKLAIGNHVYGHGQPSPDELGGYLEFADWQGKDVGLSQFIGRWTLLYFGYARCTGSCREALPLIAETATFLRDKGFAAQAAFVDIDADHIGIERLGVQESGAMRHGPNWEKRKAMQSIVRLNRNDMMILSGTRQQIAKAGIAYHVIREHVPPRKGENGHSINHSSMVYFIGPDGMVAGYCYHDAEPGLVAEVIATLDAAPRQKAETSVASRMNAGVGCGT